MVLVLNLRAEAGEVEFVEFLHHLRQIREARCSCPSDGYPYLLELDLSLWLALIPACPEA
jgi:hypothetical protein